MMTNSLHVFYNVLDILGTFVFALSGAIAAKEKNLDIFGVLIISFIVACGGGILRDVSLGATPPDGISHWRYLLTTVFAVIITLRFYKVVGQIKRPVLLFDAFGLALFAVTSASKAFAVSHNPEVAVVLGMAGAIGGGVTRDILLNRIPIILQKEIYASAALAGAAFVVIGKILDWPEDITLCTGFAICLSIRLLALHYKWNFPTR